MTYNTGKLQVLTADFFRRPAYEVAPDLVGCWIISTLMGEPRRLLISETEAYYGQNDTACHASKGRTRRTETLFGPPGVLYVYLCYGIHSLLNVVTGNEGHPEAVLIRACRGFAGPGKLTKELGITTAYNQLVLSDKSCIRFERDPAIHPLIISAPRVGINYASPDDIARPWRFIGSNL